MFFMRVLLLVFGILRSISFSMDCTCIAPLTPVVIMIRGFVSQPLFCMVLINELYFACFCVRACFGESVVAVCELNELYCMCV